MIFLNEHKQEQSAIAGGEKQSGVAGGAPDRRIATAPRNEIEMEDMESHIEHKFDPSFHSPWGRGLLLLLLAISVLFAVPQQAKAQDITTGLVGWWKLDETTGTVFYDSSGNGLDGTAAGGLDAAVSHKTGRIGGAIEFVSDSTYVAVASPSALDALNNTMSIAFWYKDDLDSTLTWTELVMKTDWTTGWAIQRSNATDDIYMRVDTSGGASQTFPLMTGVLDNNWHHVVYILDNGAERAYKDGVKVNDSTYLPGTGFANAAAAFAIGKSQDGIYDDVRMYNRALTDADVAELYATTFAGKLRYNTTFRTAEYYDGTQWVAAGPKKYVPNAVRFDGSINYLSASSPLTGVTDGTKVTASFWYKINTYPSTGCQRIVGSNPGRFDLSYCGNGTQTMQMIVRDTGGAMVANIGCGPDPHVVGQWYHHLISMDVSTGATNCYVDDVDSKQIFTAPTNTTLDFTLSQWSVGAGTSGTSQVDGDIADLWVDFNTYIDFSSVSNRRKFIDASGNPVDLGTDGSLPTGTAPDIFLSGDTANWHTNKGTGGGFNEGGTLGDGEFKIPFNDCSAMGNAYYFSSSTGECYYRNDTGDTFANAQLACQGNGGHLISINNADEEAIADYLAIDGTETWYGGKDSDNNGKWVWYDKNGNPTTQFWQGSVGGTSMGVYTNWRPDQPNNAGQDCLSSSTSNPYQGWVDTGCGGTFPYICEIEGGCANPDRVTGSIIYNTTSNVMQYCNGQDWIAMGPFPGAGGAGCSNPTGAAGGMIFNTTKSVMQYCDGTNWVSVGAKPTSCTWAQNSVTGNYYDAAFGNNTFVVVGPSGAVATSPDGSTWTTRTAAQANTWWSVAYGAGLFVAVSSNGTNRVMTSPDGITWTARTAAEQNSWWKVIYAGGQFVAVATSGTNRVMTSPDGITWTARAAAEQNDWYGLTYGAGLYVAVSGTGTHQIMTSPDGITWTARTAPTADFFNSVAYGSGRFVLLTGGQNVITSTDGINWTLRTAAAPTSDQWWVVEYGSGMFVATGYIGWNYDHVMISEDGINWRLSDAIPSNSQGTGIAFGNGTYVVSQYGQSMSGVCQ